MGSKHEALLEAEGLDGTPAGAPTWKGPKQIHFIYSSFKILKKFFKLKGKDSIEKPNFVSLGVRASKLIWVKSNKKGQGSLGLILAGDPRPCSYVWVKDQKVDTKYSGWAQNLKKATVGAGHIWRCSNDGIMKLRIKIGMFEQTSNVKWLFFLHLDVLLRWILASGQGNLLSVSYTVKLKACKFAFGSHYLNILNENP